MAGGGGGGGGREVFRQPETPPLNPFLCQSNDLLSIINFTKFDLINEVYFHKRLYIGNSIINLKVLRMAKL